MPQFSLSFRGASHIVPIFMRTMALMFAQAGLVDRNHPATRYGIEGVRKYSFAELMGEAWFSLRNQNADVRQWGLFVSVVMMIAVFVAAIATFMLNVVMGLGTSAYAQIFSHPGTPYGGGSETDIQKLTSAVNGAGSPPMFDSRTAYDAGGAPDTARASADLGLMLLDKVLRQSAAGNGGAMQSGLAGLMQVYNTGILVVAAVMIFWMILSIVVDTAKTGVVGGGRHNMVWAPIRVVFALGIMIPLGTTGFSSGQFAVMKLAEWGSNFGTRAWQGYITGVITSNGLLSPFSAQSAGAIADGLARIKTCQVAWNAEAAKQGALTPAYQVSSTPAAQQRIDRSRGTITIRYTNRASGNLCGSIELSAPTGNTAWADQPAAGNSGVSTALKDATDNFRNAMRAALQADLQDGSALMNQAQDFACGFVGRHMRPNDGSNNPVLASGQCTSDTACGSSATAFPNLSCHQSMIDSVRGRVTTAYNGGVSHLTNYITGPMLTDMTNKGWAGMGVWTYYIKVLNDLALQAREANVTISGGTMWAAPSQDWQGATPPTIEEVVKVINTDYDRWWSEQMETDASQVAAFANRQASVYDQDINKEAFEKDLAQATKGKGIMEKILRKIMPDQIGAAMFGFPDPNIYPFTRLVQIGFDIMKLFAGIMAVNTVLTLPNFPIASYKGSSLANGIHSASVMGMIAGGMIAFYIPILPLIRTTFAALTWIISVFEAVAMVPLAALGFLTSVGEGMGSREVWILWLNVLLRPVLVVLGFVASMLVFNSFVVYFSTNYANGLAAMRSDMGVIESLISYVAYTVIYVGAIYTAANTTFKLLDLIPDAMMRWMGGRADTSFTDDNTAAMVLGAGQLASNFKSSKSPGGGGGGGKGKGAKDLSPT